MIRNRKNSVKKGMKITALVTAAVLLLGIAGCGGRSQESLENEQAYRKLGISKMQEGNYEEAVDLFQKALDQSLAVIDDLEIDICYYKATAQYKMGDMEGALETCNALLDYDKKNAKAYYLRGCLYIKQDEKKALEDFQSALKYDEKNPQLYTGIAENLLNAGQADKAGEFLQKAVKLSGDEAADFREKGYAYFLMGEYDSARQQLDKAINEGDVQAILYLAKVCEATGNKEQAQQFYEKYASQNAGDTETLNTLGCLKMNEGDYAQALAFFQNALSVENPVNEQELRKNEIAALEYTQDFAAAKEKMEAYLNDYPEDEAAKREYEFLRTR